LRPALNSESFLATVWSAAYEKQRNIYQTALLLRHYNGVFRLARPTYPFQIVLYGLFALIGYLRGYRVITP
jgi:hypothetical protein